MHQVSRSAQPMQTATPHTQQTKHRARYAKQTTQQHKHTLVTLNTQNVRGMTAANRSSWLRYFRQQHDGVQPTFTILQETHTLHDERRDREEEHALGWGFRMDAATPWSVWSTSQTRAAGVAILINPHAGVTDVKPWREPDWSPRFIAITCVLNGVKWLVMNVYGPNDTADQAAFYGELASWDKPHHAILVGGDFNSCVHDLDRSHGLQTGHTCEAMEDWITNWDLADTLSEQLEDDWAPKDRRAFAAANHTFQYAIGSQCRSARLDRWYTTTSHCHWVQDTTVAIPGTPSDHHGVVVKLQDPKHRTSHKTTRQVLAKSPYVRDLQNAAATELILQLTPTFLAHTNPRDVLTAWDELKTSLRILCCKVASQARARQRKTYRQRLKQIDRQLQHVMRRHLEDGQTRSGVDGITDSMTRLTLEHPMDRIKRLKHRATQLKQNRAAHMTRRQQGRYRGRTPQTTKTFFERFSTKRAGPRTAELAGYALDAVAQAVEEDWRHIMERPTTLQQDKTEFLASCQPMTRLSPGNATALTIPIQESEVTKTLKRCRRGKACGPDGLANDFYRDQSEVMTPLLLHLFASCLQNATTPASFLEADIFCLPKQSRPATGLDFRPLALLNTDYKLYTRILSLRLRPLLSDLIHPLQSGFIPHRDIHDTIDNLQAFQDIRDPGARRTAAVLLLDFKKAYDSLDRDFLLKTMEWLDFPPQFVKVVASLHYKTTARFQINGVRSAGLHVTSGIRQGCPLAPLLFVLALEPLYQRISQHPSFDGIRLPGMNTAQLKIKVAGYADDTAIYTQNDHDRHIAEQILADFAAAAGLHINPAKTVLLPVSTRHDITTTKYHIPEPTELVRYLGVPISLGAPSTAIWEHIQKQIRTRMILAITKTTNVMQRARLASAIAVPKLTFVARHVWPTRSQADQLQRFLSTFVWNANFDTRDKTKSWLNVATATKALSQGGLNVPNVQHELIALAAATVHRQGHRPPGLRMAHSRQLQPSLISQPHRHSRQVRYRPTLHATGLLAIGALHAVPRTTAEAEAVITAAVELDRLKAQQLGWHGAELHLRCGAASDALTHARRRQARDHGECCTHWLERCDTTQGHFLLKSDGSPLRKQDISTLGSKTTLGAIMKWRWIADNHVAFTPLFDQYPFDNATADQFRLLVTLVAANYPKILICPRPSHQIILNQRHHTEVFARQTETGCEVWKQEHPFPAAPPVVIHHAAQLTPIIRSIDKALRHARHPMLTQQCQLFAATAVKDPTYKHIRKHAKTETKDAPPLLFAEITWKDINAHSVATDGEIQTFTRLKLNRMNYRVSGLPHPHCPHETCGGLQVSNQHVMWDCPIAQAAWNVVWLRWSTAMGWQTRDQMFQAAYHWQPTRFPAGWIQAVTTADAETSTPKLRWLLRQAWSAEVMATYHSIYIARIAALKGVPTTTHLMQAAAGTRLQGVQRHLADGMTGMASAKLYERVTTKMTPTTMHTAVDVWLLFFDGGARGNPGPGGAGAVLVHITPVGPSITWVSSVNHPPPATNNMAEFAALRDGMAEVQTRRVPMLNVVGDSLMIISMLQTQRSPQAPHLQFFHSQVLTSADAIPIIRWHHHVRSYNKMADAAANWAIDARASTISTHGTTSLHCCVASHLHNDTAHWISQSQCDRWPKTLDLRRNPP